MSNMTLIVVGFFFCSIPYRKSNAEFAEIISETLPNASIPYGKGKVTTDKLQYRSPFRINSLWAR